MSLIRLHSVSKSYDANRVLRDVSFRLQAGERVGLIGKNGSGKTTIFRMILGQEEPDSGAVDVTADASVGYFSQFSTLSGGMSIREILDGLFPEVHALDKELREVEAAMAEADDIDKLITRQSALLEQMERIDGWTYQSQIETVLTKLGFSEVHADRPVEQLSGGWQNRAALAKILLQDPDLLLLDEPTNFLDIEGLAWLEQWLVKLNGALIVVSHDRHFLDSVVTRVVEIENFHLHEYAGGYTQYVREKPIRLKRMERQFQYEQELLAFEAEAIRDREEARKNPSDHMKRKLANIKRSVEPRPVDRILTGIYRGLSAPEILCRVENLSKGYDGQELFSEVGFEVHRRERLAVVGPNGCGKSTLLNVLTDAELPDTGDVRWGRGDIPYAYFNAIRDDLNLNDTVTHVVNTSGLGDRAPRKQVNRFLSLMRFSEMDLRQQIGTLSGGEQARVALALCLLSGAPLIILDEPTNHLDLTSSQVMERALAHYPGGVIVVSHDRFFVDKVATRLLVFEEGSTRLRFVTGNWSTWQASREAP
ncbi:ABC-F family ATP-binding cassette domain-containing protein [Candidatus Poribacteria bacterium]|jgi:ATP-binding cassette, subfamily F, member 3|nr:ABC-F family ATP-binding cassette domain-containing protein [Candidatus Poribacteria bacterium]MBT5537042.1 ABC-F family ATP-binding cassette domain-containing protein [Candidatus Poribacteria bacterium]MBT7809007.1 ABC-F family ATP-binding cassette domain-containing protein [Candidatus Poribacteria bacterium]